MHPAHWPPTRLSVLLALAALLLAACGVVSNAQGPTVETPTPRAATAAPLAATPLPGNLDQVVITQDGKEYTIRQLLPRDGIPPVYEPSFTDALDVYDDDALVMGVEINGDARAYPVGYLRSREMVNDVVGGTPVLVTW